METAASLGSGLIADNHYLPQYPAADGDGSIGSMTPSTPLSLDSQSEHIPGERQSDSTAATTPTTSCAGMVTARHGTPPATMVTPEQDLEKAKEVTSTEKKSKRPLQLLNLPVEILKEIIKEVC